MRHVVTILLCLLAALPAMPGRAEEPDREPSDIDLEERVEVQLVLVDVVVLDRKDRTVADLTIDDFELFVGGRRTEVATLDGSCPLGAEDPRAGDPLLSLPKARSTSPRKIVLAFDYYHGVWPIRQLEYAQDAVDLLTVGGEEHMVVSLGQVLRVEQEFTHDFVEVHEALERMKTDPRLYGGNYERLTERRFFHRIEALFDLLEREPGRKVVVLFSGPFRPDGFHHDATFKEMGARAAAARVAFYPVDSRGMVSGVGLGPVGSGTAGPLMLRRLANETGGRMTANTNDLSLAYARAQRDQGCTYTLGFYDRAPNLDKSRRLGVRMVSPGYRAILPRNYVIRSDRKKQRSLVHTAGFVPSMFADDTIRTSFSILEPLSSRRWETLVGIHILLADADAVASTKGEWNLQTRIRKPWGTVVKRVQRKLALPAGPSEWFERLELKPGYYDLDIVLSHPALVTPRAATTTIHVPEVPPDEIFLVGPVLGQPYHDTVGVADNDPRRRTGIEPLVVRQVSGNERLSSFINVCHVGRQGAMPDQMLWRTMVSEDGEFNQEFPPASVAVPTTGKVRCSAVVDALPVGLSPGQYTMRVFTNPANPEGGGTAGFTIVTPAP